MDAVTQIVTLRSRESDGLDKMVGASIAAHVVIVAIVALGPAWFGKVEVPPENVMTISLSGAPGERTGGMTPIGGRPVQQITESPKAIEPVRAPAARTPEMIEPTKVAKRPDPKVQNSPAKSPTSRTPTKGQEVEKGSAAAQTSARGQGFGLTSTGGGGTGSYLDTANFCCPEYIATMLDLIRRNWDSRQQSAGTAVVKYTIARDGTISAVQVEKTSGFQTLDFLASRALLLTRQLPPLPGAFTEASLTVHLAFEYQR